MKIGNISSNRVTVFLLQSPGLYCFLHDRLTNQERSCSYKEQQLYLESQETEKMVDYCPKEPCYQSQNSGSFYAKSVGSVVHCCKLLGVGVLCSCSHPLGVRSQNSRKPLIRLFFAVILQLFIFIQMEKCYTFKGQSLQNVLSYIFQISGYRCSSFVAKVMEYKS